MRVYVGWIKTGICPSSERSKHAFCPHLYTFAKIPEPANIFGITEWSDGEVYYPRQWEARLREVGKNGLDWSTAMSLTQQIDVVFSDS
jgi:hypothetical protein